MNTPNEMYNLVITGGRVMDPETGLDAVRNVGVKDGKIAAVTEKNIQGRESIDASGHVVSPGFIDMHNHNAGVPFGEKLALRDGVSARTKTVPTEPTFAPSLRPGFLFNERSGSGLS